MMRVFARVLCLLVLWLGCAQNDAGAVGAYMPEGGSKCEAQRQAQLGQNPNPADPGNAAGNASVLYYALPCPTTWLSQTTAAINASKLPQGVARLTWAVWLLGLVWVGIRVANGTESSDGRGLFARLLISSWLVVSAGGLSGAPGEYKGDTAQLVRSAWVEAYTWGDATFAGPALKEAAEESRVLADSVSRLVLLYGGLQVTAEAVKGGVNGASQGLASGKPVFGGILGALFGGAQGLGNAALTTAQVGIVAINMSMPILITYYLIILATGLATLFASLLLPLVGAMFIYSAQLGAQYAQTWFRTVVSAVITMAVMPAIFAGALQLGFVEPSRNFEVATTRTEKALEADAKKITELAQNGEISQYEAVRRQIINALSQTANKLDVAGYLTAVISSVLLMIFSLLTSLYLLRLAQNWLMEFLGGVAAAVSGGSSGAGRVASGFGGSRGGGSSRSGSSRDSRRDSRDGAGSGGAGSVRTAPANAPTAAPSARPGTGSAAGSSATSTTAPSTASPRGGPAGSTPGNAGPGRGG